MTIFHKKGIKSLKLTLWNINIHNSFEINSKRSNFVIEKDTI